MNDIFIYSIITVSSIGVIAALVLYFVAQKFKVYEDPRIDEVEESLPGANCGGCGFPGCRGFAEACVKSNEFENLFCPVGGNDCMAQVAKILGKEAIEQEPMIAVLRCNGACDRRPKTNEYDGAKSCAITSLLYSGDTGCQYGCLGHGDCVDVCSFGALSMDEETGLPVVDQDKCTACGDCVEACPKNLFELRKKGKRDRRVYVACMNQEKGGVAKKSCASACIGCSKCVKVCPADAIEVKNFLSYIDYNLCIGCRKCVPECPTEAILAVNYPPLKKPVKKKTSATVKTTAAKQEDNKTENKQQ